MRGDNHAELAPVRVLPVRTFRDRQRFIAFPYELYRSSAYWTPPLRREQAQLVFSKKNPFFQHGTIAPFIAEDASGRVLGRIAAIVNGTHRERYDDGVGFFGFFECLERYDVAAQLFDAASAQLKAEGFSALRGPMNPSINDCSGLLVNGFDRRPSLLMPYNPPYYHDFLLRYGFVQKIRMTAFYGAWRHLNVSRLQRGAEIVERRLPKLRVRNPDMDHFDAEVRIMWQIYNQAFAGGWGHVPLSEAEFEHMARSMRPILDPRLIFFLEHDGAPVGFSLSLPDVSPLLRRVKNGRLFPFGFIKLLGGAWFGECREVRTAVLALLPEYQRRGLDTLLVLKTIEHARQNGYVAGELSWVMENNLVLRNALGNLGAVVDKEYAIFEKQI